MRRANLAVWVWAGLAWPVLAAAENAFENNLGTYGWKTWLIIASWCVGGIALRWAYDHGEWRNAVKAATAAGLPLPEHATWRDLVAMSVVAFFSGTIAFAIMEWYFAGDPVPPPSGIIGAVVALAAFNNKRTISAVSDVAFAALDWVAKKRIGNGTDT